MVGYIFTCSEPVKIGYIAEGSAKMNLRFAKKDFEAFIDDTAKRIDYIVFQYTQGFQEAAYDPHIIPMSNVGMIQLHWEEVKRLQHVLKEIQQAKRQDQERESFDRELALDEVRE